MDDPKAGSAFDKDVWLNQLKKRRDNQIKNIQFLKDNPHFEETKIRQLDSTLKKVTGFMKKVKNIGITVSPDTLVGDMSKLNLSKFVDETAQIVVEAKMKLEELGPLLKFCLAMAQIYEKFSTDLVAEFKKQFPIKRSDQIRNPSKFLADLVLNGVVGPDGIQLLGQVLGYLIQTDKTDHLNISVLMPFCRFSYFDCTGVPPMGLTEADVLGAGDFKPLVLLPEQRKAINGLFEAYWASLVDHLSSTRQKMNGVLKFIKRQERTRGDCSQDDRTKLDDLRAHFDRLQSQASELGPWLGHELPEMPEELSDDEEDEAEAKQLDVELAQGKQSLWPDDDTRVFYEHIAAQNSQPTAAEDEAENEANENDENFAGDSIEQEVDNVFLEDLILQESDEGDEVKEEETPPAEEAQEEQAPPDESTFSPFVQHNGPAVNMSTFLTKLSNAINKERIDGCAIEFITSFNRKANRKKLIQHLVASPFDRLDLLPFYTRFMATIRPTVPDVPRQVTHALLEKFRNFAKKPVELRKHAPNQAPDRSKSIDAKVHVSKYVAELVKFRLLPRAEGLACLRWLLVDLRNYKVDMLAAMIESMGSYLYKSPESHAKMKVIVTVLNTKSQKLKDSRQKLLLENAYFCVLPPEEETVHVSRRPPLQEYIAKNVLAGNKPLRTLRRVNWTDENLRVFTMKLLTDACAVPFAELERLAKVVSALSDYQSWVGIFVVDDVLEFIRLALEVDNAAMHQRLFSSVVYLGQLFNYTVCGTLVIFKVLYQLISFGITTNQGPLMDCAVRIRRVRLAVVLVRTVGEFFGEGKAKERLDCFLTYLLLFFHDTKQHWLSFAEIFGEFPLDVDFELEGLFDKFRPASRDQFPQDLEQAKLAVQRIQEQYRERAEQFLKKDPHLIQPDEKVDEKPRRLFCITEEDDEEGGVKPDSVPNSPDPPQPSPDQPNDSQQNAGGPSFDFDNEEDEPFEIKNETKVTEEDEEFLMDFDRVLSETFQTAVIPKVPVIDLEVPPSARQKFERKITFAEDTKQNGTSSMHYEDPKPRAQMALMTRKGNRTVLKAVNLESSQSMQEAWREQRERQERERREMKHITLAMDERQYQQQQAELMAQVRLFPSARTANQPQAP